jgi:hypothetical protein
MNLNIGGYKMILLISFIFIIVEAKVTLVQSEFPIKIGAEDASSCDTIGSSFDVNEPPQAGAEKQYVVVGGKTKSNNLLSSVTGCQANYIPFFQIFSQYNTPMGLANNF